MPFEASVFIDVVGLAESRIALAVHADNYRLAGLGVLVYTYTVFDRQCGQLSQKGLRFADEQRVFLWPSLFSG